MSIYIYIYIPTQERPVKNHCCIVGPVGAAAEGMSGLRTRVNVGMIGSLPPPSLASFGVKSAIQTEAESPKLPEGS